MTQARVISTYPPAGGGLVTLLDQALAAAAEHEITGLDFTGYHRIDISLHQANAQAAEMTMRMSFSDDAGVSYGLGHSVMFNINSEAVAIDVLGNSNADTVDGMVINNNQDTTSHYWSNSGVGVKGLDNSAHHIMVAKPAHATFQKMAAGQGNGNNNRGGGDGVNFEMYFGGEIEDVAAIDTIRIKGDGANQFDARLVILGYPE